MPNMLTFAQDAFKRLAISELPTDTPNERRAVIEELLRANMIVLIEQELSDGVVKCSVGCTYYYDWYHGCHCPLADACARPSKYCPGAVGSTFFALVPVVKLHPLPPQHVFRKEGD